MSRSTSRNEHPWTARLLAIFVFAGVLVGFACFQHNEKSVAYENRTSGVVLVVLDEDTEFSLAPGETKSAASRENLLPDHVVARSDDGTVLLDSTFKEWEDLERIDFRVVITDEGDGGDESLERYFQELVEVTDEGDATGAELSATLDDELAASDSDEAAIAAWDRYFEVSLPLEQAFVEDLKAISQPTAVREAHGDLVAFFEALVRAVTEIDQELPGVGTEAELDALFAEGVSPLLPMKDAACFDLQEIADHYFVDVDLECEE